MDLIIGQILGVIVRYGVLFGINILIASGLVTENAGLEFAVHVTSFLVAMGVSIYQKYVNGNNLEKALAATPGTPLEIAIK